MFYVFSNVDPSLILLFCLPSGIVTVIFIFKEHKILKEKKLKKDNVQYIP